jgi:hypothetical protein
LDFSSFHCGVHLFNNSGNSVLLSLFVDWFDFGIIFHLGATMTRIRFYILLIVFTIFGCVIHQTLDELKKNDALVEAELLDTIDWLVNVVDLQEIVIQSQEAGLAQAENEYAELEEDVKRFYMENCRMYQVIQQMHAYIQELEAALQGQQEDTGDKVTGRYHYRKRTSRFFKRVIA